MNNIMCECFRYNIVCSRLAANLQFNVKIPRGKIIQIAKVAIERRKASVAIHAVELLKFLLDGGVRGAM